MLEGIAADAPKHQLDGERALSDEARLPARDTTVNPGSLSRE